MNCGFPVFGSLSRHYDILFHHSLWLSYPMPTTIKAAGPHIVESDLIRKSLDTDLRQWPNNMPTDTDSGTDKSIFGLVPREWLQVRRNDQRQKSQHKNCYPQFWPTQHLQPVFHVAHTDTIMMINVVAMLMLAGNKDYGLLLDTLQDAAPRLQTKKNDALEVYKLANKILSSHKPTKKEIDYFALMEKDFAARHQKKEEAVYNSLSVKSMLCCAFSSLLCHRCYLIDAI